MNIWKLKKNNKKSSSNAWNSKKWLDKIDQRIKNNIVSLKSKNSIKISTFCAESPLPIMLLSQKKRLKF